MLCKLKKEIICESQYFRCCPDLAAGGEPVHGVGGHPGVPPPLRVGVRLGVQPPLPHQHRPPYSEATLTLQSHIVYGNVKIEEPYLFMTTLLGAGPQLLTVSSLLALLSVSV